MSGQRRRAFITGVSGQVDHLCGDASKARRVLGWQPTVNYPELVALLVDADVRLLAGGSASTATAEWLAAAKVRRRPRRWRTPGPGLLPAARPS